MTLIQANENSEGPGAIPVHTKRSKKRVKDVIKLSAFIATFSAWFYFLEYPTRWIAGGADWSFYGSTVTGFFPNANPYYFHIGDYETFGNSSAALSAPSQRWQVILPIPFAGVPTIPLLVIPVLAFAYFFLGRRKHLKAASIVSVILCLWVIS